MSCRRPARALPLPPIRSSQPTLLGHTDDAAATPASRPSAPASSEPDLPEAARVRPGAAAATMLPPESPAANVLQQFALHVLRTSRARPEIERPRPVVLAKSACGPPAPPPKPAAPTGTSPASFPPVACTVQINVPAASRPRRPRWAHLSLAALAAGLLVAVIVVGSREGDASAAGSAARGAPAAQAAQGQLGATAAAFAQRASAAAASRAGAQRAATRTAEAATTRGTVVAIAPPGICRLWIAGSPFDTSGRARASLRPGRHLVACQRRGHGTRVRWASVEAGATARVVF